MFAFLENVHKWWCASRRSIDMNVLWPICKSQAPNLELARAAFLIHMSSDPAWSGMSEDEIDSFVREKLV